MANPQLSLDAVMRASVPPSSPRPYQPWQKGWWVNHSEQRCGQGWGWEGNGWEFTGQTLVLPPDAIVGKEDEWLWYRGWAPDTIVGDPPPLPIRSRAPPPRVVTPPPRRVRTPRFVPAPKHAPSPWPAAVLVPRDNWNYPRSASIWGPVGKR